MLNTFMNHEYSNKFIAGIGTPIDISPESMTVGYVLKAQYFLPYNESHLYPTRFEKRDIVDDHRRFMTYDTTKSGIDEYSDENESLNDNARWSIYQILSLQLQKSFKVDGMKCIQKYICEATQSSFSYKSGLLGEILHILLVPSTTTLERNDYTYAEDIGRKNINCQRAFATCELPLLNYFSSLL
ncbi:unnamed protein product [Chironomus riparius]|uniref:Uncharacterized protein n=1 Tax=Chironomus riparius TaxID=315576 RepID=A0A9N9RYY0_9DIPT|nr:unnamed protein product [Chironomus riparius]